MRRLVGIAIAAVPLLVAGCDAMSHQKRYDSYERSALFSDGKSLQAPPDGTVARDDPAWQAALDHRPDLTLALVERGRQRYDIDCKPCHDAAGYGQGVIPSRGFPHPPSFHGDRLRDVAPAYIVDVITHGYGVMYSYADRVAPADRWAIASYIKALQLSQDAPADALSAADRTRLEGAAP